MVKWDLGKSGILVSLFAYYAIIGKYIFDLYSFFTHRFLGLIALYESRIPVESSLFPWPYVNLPSSRGFEPIVVSTRPLTLAETLVRDYCYKIPLVIVVFMAMPLIIVGFHQCTEKIRYKKLLIFMIIFLIIGTLIWVYPVVAIYRIDKRIELGGLTNAEMGQLLNTRRDWEIEQVLFYNPCANFFFATGIFLSVLVMVIFLYRSARETRMIKTP